MAITQNMIYKMHFGDHILHNLLLLKSKNYRKLYKYFASSEFSPFSAKIRQFEVLPSANGNPSNCRFAVGNVQYSTEYLF